MKTLPSTASSIVAPDEIAITVPETSPCLSLSIGVDGLVVLIGIAEAVSMSRTRDSRSSTAICSEREHTSEILFALVYGHAGESAHCEGDRTVVDICPGDSERFYHVIRGNDRIRDNAAAVDHTKDWTDDPPGNSAARTVSSSSLTGSDSITPHRIGAVAM